MNKGKQQMAQIACTLRVASARYQDDHGGVMPEGLDAAAFEREEGLFGEMEAKTPFDEIEERQRFVEGMDGEEAARVAMESHAWLLSFLFAEGPHPALVMRRLYCWLKKYHPEKIWDMGYRHLGLLLGESHAAMAWRVEVMLTKYAQAIGLRGVKAPWQKPEEANGKYEEAQRANCNRLGGKKSAKAKLRKKAK